jgi:hypothetical protein
MGAMSTLSLLVSHFNKSLAENETNNKAYDNQLIQLTVLLTGYSKIRIYLRAERAE